MRHRQSLRQRKSGKLATILVFLIFLLPAYGVEQAKILKVLPQLLDLKGHESLAPSLYERDAYQARLRKKPSEIGGMRYAVQWRARPAGRPLKLRVEMRGSKEIKTIALEEEIRSTRWHSGWTYLKVDQKTLREVGEILSWRVTLWDKDQLVAEQRSFLWTPPPS